MVDETCGPPPKHRERLYHPGLDVMTGDDISMFELGTWMIISIRSTGLIGDGPDQWRATTTSCFSFESWPVSGDRRVTGWKCSRPRFGDHGFYPSFHSIRVAILPNRSRTHRQAGATEDRDVHEPTPESPPDVPAVPDQWCWVRSFHTDVCPCALRRRIQTSSASSSRPCRFCMSSTKSDSSPTHLGS